MVMNWGVPRSPAIPSRTLECAPARLSLIYIGEIVSDDEVNVRSRGDVMVMITTRGEEVAT